MFAIGGVLLLPRPLAEAKIRPTPRSTTWLMPTGEARRGEARILEVPGCFSFALDKPTVAPGDQAVAVLRSILDPVRPLGPDQEPFRPGWLGADRDYPSNSAVADFHQSVRDMGYPVVMGDKKNELGRQGPADGAMLVEGTWYCPSMHAVLVDASKDRRAGTITEDQYVARIAERAAYQFKPYDTAPSGRTRWTCLASGPSPTARCPLRCPSMLRFGGPQVVAVHIAHGDALPAAVRQEGGLRRRRRGRPLAPVPRGGGPPT